MQRRSAYRVGAFALHDLLLEGKPVLSCVGRQRVNQVSYPCLSWWHHLKKGGTQLAGTALWCQASHAARGPETRLYTGWPQCC